MFPADRGPTPRYDLFERLRDPQLYAAACERVRARHVGGDQARPLASGGPWLAAIANLAGLSQVLARDVGALEYELSPMLVRQALIRGQPRTLYVATPLDEIVLSALSTACSELLEGFLSPCVFSYRRGRSSLGLIGAWLEYLRAHRARSSERQDWGLYLLRRDVRGYGDAIAAGPDSQLWSLLAEALAAAGRAATEAQQGWLRRAFRPAIESAEGARSLPACGIPTGSPLQPAACNLYLTSIDRWLEAVPGGFYARYGDDMLFAHPDAQLARTLARGLDARLASLGLTWSTDKCADLFFNLAGRSPPQQNVGFRGASALDYLGFRIDFRGVIGLPRLKLRQLLHDVSLRLAQSDRLLVELAPGERARDLCAIANAVLDPEHASANPSAAALRYVVSDRAQLRDLDYKIALRVAQQLASRRGVRAFRAHPPAQLHAELGLRSLVRARNQVGRAQRSHTAHA